MKDSEKAKAKQQAHELITYCYGAFCSITFNSDGQIMTKKEVMPKVKMIANSHIRFYKQNAKDLPCEFYDIILEEIEKHV